MGWIRWQAVGQALRVLALCGLSLPACAQRSGSADPLPPAVSPDRKRHNARKIIVLDAKCDRKRALGGILDHEQPGRRLDAGDDLRERRLEGRIAAMHDDIGIHIAPDILRRQMIEGVGEGHATEVSGALHPASECDFCSDVFNS